MGVGKGCWGKKAGLLAPPKCDGIPSPAGGGIQDLGAEAHGLTLAGRREVASPLEQGPTPNPEGRHGSSQRLVQALSSHLPPLHTQRYTHSRPSPCPVKLRLSALDVQTRLASDTSYPRVPSSRHACRQSCHDAEKDLPFQ